LLGGAIWGISSSPSGNELRLTQEKLTVVSNKLLDAEASATKVKTEAIYLDQQLRRVEEDRDAYLKDRADIRNETTSYIKFMMNLSDQTKVAQFILNTREEGPTPKEVVVLTRHYLGSMTPMAKPAITLLLAHDGALLEVLWNQPLVHGAIMAVAPSSKPALAVLAKYPSLLTTELPADLEPLNEAFMNDPDSDQTMKMITDLFKIEIDKDDRWNVQSIVAYFVRETVRSGVKSVNKLRAGPLTAIASTFHIKPVLIKPTETIKVTPPPVEATLSDLPTFMTPPPALPEVTGKMPTVLPEAPVLPNPAG
jgi:hypothetical protein